MKKLKVLDLFSGIGGFSLGLERTGGFETVAFCEIDPFCRRVLAKHWPTVPCFEDVTTLRGESVGRIDLISGGFPCQDISSAGRLGGMDEGTRSGLWSEIARLVGELSPSYVLVENVSNLLSGPSQQPGGWFGRVLGDLAALGYDAEWHCIPASAVGAPHSRERVWIVAYTRKAGPEAGAILSKISFETLHWSGFSDSPQRRFEADGGFSYGVPESLCVDDGLSFDVDASIGALGNAVVPQIPELIGRAILELDHSS